MFDSRELSMQDWAPDGPWSQSRPLMADVSQASFIICTGYAHGEI